MKKLTLTKCLTPNLSIKETGSDATKNHLSDSRKPVLLRSRVSYKSWGPTTGIDGHLGVSNTLGGFKRVRKDLRGSLLSWKGSTLIFPSFW